MSPCLRHGLPYWLPRGMRRRLNAEIINLPNKNKVIKGHNEKNSLRKSNLSSSPPSSGIQNINRSSDKAQSIAKPYVYREKTPKSCEEYQLI